MVAAVMKCLSEEEKLLLDFVEKCLDLDPAKRITCEEALEHPYFAQVMEESKSMDDIKISENS